MDPASVLASGELLKWTNYVLGWQVLSCFNFYYSVSNSIGDFINFLDVFFALGEHIPRMHVMVHARCCIYDNFNTTVKHELYDQFLLHFHFCRFGTSSLPVTATLAIVFQRKIIMALKDLSRSIK